MPETVIIGAGPAGLGAATRLEQLSCRDWVVLEKDGIPGGLSASVVDENGFTWDMGGHVTFSHYQYFDQFLDAVVPDWHNHKRCARILLRDRWVPYPFQNHIRFLAPEDQQRCIEGLRNRRGGVPANFQEWIDLSFGQGIAELFLNPYNFKVWAYPPSDLSVEWVDERVSTVDLDKISASLNAEAPVSDWGPNAMFRFPIRGGTGRVWMEAAARLPQHKIRYQSGVRKVDAGKRIVYTEDGAYAYEHLISTMPIDQLLSLMDPTPDMQGAIKPVFSSVHVVGLGMTGEPPENIRDFSWMYFPESNTPFFRVTLFSSYAATNAPSGCWSLLLEVSESCKKPLVGDPVQECLRGALNVGLLRPDHKIVSQFHRRLDYAYPIPYVGRNDFVRRADSYLNPLGILSRGRFGSWKYEVGNQDHCFMQGVEAADCIFYGADEVTYSYPQLVNNSKQTARRFKEPRLAGQHSPFLKRIYEDLAPWRGQGITRELFDRVKRRSWKGVHVKILKGEVHLHREIPSVGARNQSVMLMLQAAAARHPLPDCEFIVHTGDDSPGSNLPIFTFRKQGSDKSILFPDASFYAWPEAQLPDFDSVKASLCGKMPCWKDKADAIRCLGSARDPKIKAWAHQDDERLDIRILEQSGARAGIAELKEHGDFKCLAPFQGQNIAPMLKYLFLTNSVVILNENEPQEFWHSILDPGHNCLCHNLSAPDSMSSLQQKLAAIPQDMLQDIAAQGRSAVSETLSMEAVYEYIARLLSQYAELAKFPIIEKEYMLVIARYNEDVSWADGHPRVVYNKGARLEGLSEQEQIMAPNVGRESHTYLTYIIDNYQNLPDHIMFCQGGIKDHVEGFRVEDYVNPSYDMVCARVVTLKEWNPATGRLNHFGIWQEKLEKGAMRAGRLTYLEWFEKVLGVPLAEGTVYIPGAIFSVSSRNIRQRPIEFYVNLRKFVDDHPDPEEGHYLERSWLYIFAMKGMRTLLLS